MKNPSIPLCAALLLAAVVGGPVAAAPAGVAELPELTSHRADPFTPVERDAVVAWTLAQPAVQAHLGDSRTRVLRAGSDLPKREDGSTYRRASLFVRNYDTGLTSIIRVDLDRGEVSIGDTDALVQPNPEEIDAAAAIVRADEGLRELVEDDELVLNGAFFLRSPYRDDPCHRNVCLLFHFVDPGSTRPARSVHRVLVDMTRGMVVPNDYDYAAIWDTPANALLPLTTEVR